MLRRTLRALGRPYGPNKSSSELRRDSACRSEVTMLKHTRDPKQFMDMRQAFKTKIKISRTTAIPRDLGELPRNYALKLLFFNQPCVLPALWKLVKDRDDAPMDSMRHLRQVLKIARLQNWVYTEKNQTNNEWYFYIHKSRMDAVQEMILVEKNDKAREDTERATEAAEEQAAGVAQREEALDSTIRQLQHQLIATVVKIREHDPAVAAELPFVTGSGAVNVTWYRGPGDGTAQAEAENDA
jgi:hypothetical protein